LLQKGKVLLLQRFHRFLVHAGRARGAVPEHLQKKKSAKKGVWGFGARQRMENFGAKTEKSKHLGFAAAVNKNF
jgi:hypothetical protein